MKFPLFQVVVAVMPLVLGACSSGPRIRDTSHDDPQKIAEIKRLVNQPKLHTSVGREGRFAPNESYGWATYKIFDKETNTVSALEIQTSPAPGGSQLEVRNISPDQTFVTRMVFRNTKRAVGKFANGKTINREVARVIHWVEGEKVAKEFPQELISESNALVGRVAPFLTEAISAESPRKSVTVPAGTFTGCFIKRTGKFLLILGENEETCYSGRIPVPHIVQRESDSSTQELVRYGFGLRRSFLPSSVKIVVNEELRPRRKTQPVATQPTSRAQIKTAENKGGLLDKVFSF